MNNLFLDLEKEKHTKIKKKKEYENLTFKLSNDLLEMSQQREKEKLEFENWKIEEIRKLQKDFKTENNKDLKDLSKIGRVSFSTNVVISKKDKDEIESLKTTITNMQDEMKLKDQSNKTTVDNMKVKLEEANNKIKEMTKLINELSNKNSTLTIQN